MSLDISAIDFTWLGFVAPMVIYAWVFLLMNLMPARRVEGYILDPLTQAPAVYYLNGIWVALATLLAWLLFGLMNWLPWDWFYQQRWSALAGAFVLGLVYTLVLVLPAQTTGRNIVPELFLGRRENKTYFGRVDAKMYLYLAGAVMLLLNVLSFTWFHFVTFGSQANPGVYLYAFLFTFFVFDYLVFERVHLYTYDLFAERLGFKLAWGCFVFYPFFYVIGLWGTVTLPRPDLLMQFGSWWIALSALVFLLGWLLARGANMQKYWFKRFPQQAFLGRWYPQVISDGQHQLLCNGFWGVSRHVNYLGEILMATGLALALGHIGMPWPWLYPLYYVLLLVPRERDDDRRCASKYGPLWQTYKETVPARIIPFVY